MTIMSMSSKIGWVPIPFVIIMMIVNCPVSFGASDWAERRWEVRFDACEQANSYVLIRSPDDQECAVLCGLLPTPKLVPLANGSICKTNKGEPGTCNRGECFAREVKLDGELDYRSVENIPIRRRNSGRRIIDP